MHNEDFSITRYQAVRALGALDHGFFIFRRANYDEGVDFLWYELRSVPSTKCLEFSEHLARFTPIAKCLQGVG